MRGDSAFYLTRLYPMQDRVLAQLASVETGFYLTGGTAASRAYLHHRFSDDLDLFVNDDARFGLWAQRVVQALARAGDWHVTVVQQDARFVRLTVAEGDLVLKIEMVNDVPAHVGELKRDPVLGLLDSPENILANKLTAVVSARCAPMTSLLSRDTSAPVWAWVKKATGICWTWSKRATRRSKITPSPMRAEYHRSPRWRPARVTKAPIMASARTAT